MAILTYNSESYTVDKAVKGADFIHGYDAAGQIVVSFEGISDFTQYTYDGTYIDPAQCFEEDCNTVVVHNGTLKRKDGTSVPTSVFNADVLNVTASRALALTDAGCMLCVDSTSDIVLTIPADADVAFPLYTELEIGRLGSGAVSFAVANGATLLSVDSAVSIAAQNACVGLKKIAANKWLLTGNLG